MRLTCFSIGLAFLAGAVVLPVRPAAAQFYEYRVSPITPSVQTQSVIDFTAPYFNFLITNDGFGTDFYRLEVLNLSVSPTPDWFQQVCLRSLCFPDSTTIMIAGGQTDTIGVNVVPFSDGVGTFDFRITSLGDSSLVNDFVGLTLFAGTAAVDAGQPTAAGVRELALSQNVPNPARGLTRIAFALPESAPVSLQVFDVAGRLVRTLTERRMEPGTHDVAWDALDRAGRPVPAGVYYYRLSTPEQTQTKRLTLVR
ncbi:MAG TPA: FlgD immunoglobulin-like domain containing protein [bacterium]|nr:FlgD immunoglobulin-like domain containing protein [bacterium]